MKELRDKVYLDHPLGEAFPLGRKIGINDKRQTLCQRDDRSFYVLDDLIDYPNRNIRVDISIEKAKIWIKDFLSMDIFKEVFGDLRGGFGEGFSKNKQTRIIKKTCVKGTYSEGLTYIYLSKIPLSLKIKLSAEDLSIIVRAMSYSFMEGRDSVFKERNDERKPYSHVLMA